MLGITVFIVLGINVFIVLVDTVFIVLGNTVFIVLGITVFIVLVDTVFIVLGITVFIVLGNTVFIVLGNTVFIVLVTVYIVLGIVFIVLGITVYIVLGITVFIVLGIIYSPSVCYISITSCLTQCSLLYIFTYSIMLGITVFIMLRGLVLWGDMHTYCHYSYYCLTAFFPLESFSWKKHVTQMQLAQFCLEIVISVYGFLYEGHCVYSIVYPLVLIPLFSNYYYHAFLCPPRRKPHAQ